MTDFFYTCNHCGKVLIDDRYHLAGSKDYDICHYDYNQLSMENKALFVYAQNEHMGGPTGFSGVGGGSVQCDASTSTSSLSPLAIPTIPGVPVIPSAPASPEEDYQQALLGIDSDDERSEDSMSTGSLNDFLDNNTLPMEEEQVSEYEIIEFEDFFADMPEEGETVPMTPKLCVTRMEGEYGESDSDWSETEDEDEDEVEQALRETASDRAEARMAESNPEIIRVPNRAFGKRVIKPRVGNLFTYPAKWIKNGGDGEF